MKINNSFTTPNFKGYDAAPLKKLYMSSGFDEFKPEMDNISKKENFEMCYCNSAESFDQDFKVVLNKDNSTFLNMKSCFYQLGIDDTPEVEKEYGLKVNRYYKDMLDDENFIDGGNCFLGKFENGKKWMLIGNLSNLGNKLDIDEISKEYDVEPQNILFLNQQDYHLDMFIRPIGFPYVLIDDPALNEDKRNLDPTICMLEKQNVEKLKAFGFKPIEISGNKTNGVNFMNAVVNKHPDGSISYITNSSETDDPKTIEQQKKFEFDLEKALRKAKLKDKNVPKLKNIYFVKGEINGKYNDVMINLMEGAGGIHCMTLEHPDFDKWA